MNCSIILFRFLILIITFFHILPLSFEILIIWFYSILWSHHPLLESIFLHFFLIYLHFFSLLWLSQTSVLLKTFYFYAFFIPLITLIVQFVASLKLQAILIFQSPPSQSSTFQTAPPTIFLTASINFNVQSQLIISI